MARKDISNYKLTSLTPLKLMYLHSAGQKCKYFSIGMLAHGSLWR